MVRDERVDFVGGVWDVGWVDWASKRALGEPLPPSCRPRATRWRPAAAALAHCPRQRSAPANPAPQPSPFLLRLAGTEVKDKTDLTDARKAVERAMERFKVCERDSKTKAFSREGLVAQSRLDPREARRCEARDWINAAVGSLTEEVDAAEGELERCDDVFH